MRTRPIRKFCALLTALCCAVQLAACGGASASGSSSSSSGTASSSSSLPASSSGGASAAAGGGFVLPYSASDGFNPYLTDSAVTLLNSRLIFENLVDITNDCGIVYRAAAGVSVSGTTVTITVSGSYADGTAVTPEDVAASLLAAKNSSLFRSRFAGVSAVSSDGSAVTVQLAKPDSLFAYLLDIPVMKASEVGEASPTSSGRYSVSASESGTVLTANSGFTPPAGLETIRLTEISSYDAMLSAIKTGVISLFSSENESELAGSVTCNTSYYNRNNLVFLGIEAGAGSPLGHSELRRAISLAVSRSEIESQAYYSRAYYATGVVNPRFPGEAEAKTLSENADAAAAKALIESLGYTLDAGTGFYADAAGSPLAFTLVCYAGSSYKTTAANLVAQQLAACGIQVTVDAESSFEAYREKIVSGQAALYIGEVKLYNDMDLNVFFGTDGEAHAGLQISEALAAAYEAFRADSSSLAAFETAFAAGMPFVPLVYKNGVVLTGKKYTGLTPTMSDVFYDLGSGSLSSSSQ